MRFPDAELRYFRFILGLPFSEINHLARTPTQPPLFLTRNWWTVSDS